MGARGRAHLVLSALQPRSAILRLTVLFITLAAIFRAMATRCMSRCVAPCAYTSMGLFLSSSPSPSASRKAQQNSLRNWDPSPVPQFSCKSYDFLALERVVLSVRPSFSSSNWPWILVLSSTWPSHSLVASVSCS